MRRVLNELHLGKIAAVDNPCQEGARMTIMKRADGPERATGFWAALRKIAPDEFALAALGRTLDGISEDDSLDFAKRAELIDSTEAEFVAHCNAEIGGVTAQIAERVEDMLKRAKQMSTDAELEAEARRKKAERAERERRAASARANLTHPFDQTTETTKMAYPKTRSAVFAEMAAIAKSARKPGETGEQAYARCLTADSTMHSLFMLSKTLPPDPPPAPPTPRSILKSAADASPAYAELLSKAEALQKAEPKLTDAQAFAKVYEDRANRDIVKRCMAEAARRVA